MTQLECAESDDNHPAIAGQSLCNHINQSLVHGAANPLWDEALFGYLANE
jgi:hypothetical protein